MNNSSSSNSHSPIRERKRTPMACMNCRTRKLKCRSSEPTEYAPCERCVKEGLPCEYRPVDQGPASNSHHSNQDNSVNLYPVPSAHPANHWSQSNAPPSTSGGYRPDYPYNPPTQASSHANQSLYLTPPGQYEQMMPHSSYPAPQHHTYTTWPSAYPAGQPNYRTIPQFGNHTPNQPMPYHASTPAPASYDHRTYLDNYGNWQMDNSKPTNE